MVSKVHVDHWIHQQPAQGQEELARICYGGLEWIVMEVADEAVASDEPYDIIELPSRTEFIIAISEDFLAVLEDDQDFESEEEAALGRGILYGALVASAASDIIEWEDD